MEPRTPAEWKTLFESEAFARQTEYYGPLGVELKNSIRAYWWRKFVHESPTNVGIDAAILMNPKVWEATGHVSTFNDPMVDCKACKARHQKDAAEHRAEAGQGLVPLFGVLLLGSGHIVAVDRLSVPGRLTGTGVLGAEIAGIFRVLLLLFFGIPVNGTQDEEQDAQPGRHGEYYQQGNGGNVGKKMFAASGLHGAESS